MTNSFFLKRALNPRPKVGKVPTNRRTDESTGLWALALSTTIVDCVQHLAANSDSSFPYPSRDSKVRSRGRRAVVEPQRPILFLKKAIICWIKFLKWRQKSPM